MGRQNEDAPDGLAAYKVFLLKISLAKFVFPYLDIDIRRLLQEMILSQMIAEIKYAKMKYP